MKKSVLLVLLSVLSIVLCSCKRQTPDPAPDTPTAQPPAVQTPTLQIARPDDGAPAPEAALEPIPLVLPKPMFVGTPENIEGIANLEKPLGRARDPFLAPAGTTVVSAGKPVSASEPEPIYGRYDWIVDGDKEAGDGSLVEMGPFTQWVQIDLEQECDIYAVVVWHYHKTPRVYKDVVVQVSGDPDFIEAQTIFNNDHDNSIGLGAGRDNHYVETAEGKLIDAKGVRGRYVRLYSTGSSSSDLNHYIEVEVFGKPAQ